MLVRPRVQACPRGSTRSRVGPVIGEEDAPVRQGVQGRRLDHGMTEGGQAVPTPLVERDEEDVARGRHDTTLAHVTHPEPGRPAGWRNNRSGPDSRRANGRPSELGSEPDQPRPEAWRHGPVQRSATGNRDSGDRAMHRGGPTRRSTAARRSTLSCRSHQIPSMGVGLRLHCPGLDHPFTSLASRRCCITNPTQQGSTLVDS